MLSVKRESLISSFPIWIHFISLCCLIAVARASNTMLNKSGESGHPCCVPDLNRKAANLFKGNSQENKEATHGMGEDICK